MELLGVEKTGRQYCMNIFYAQTNLQIDQIRKLFRDYESFLSIDLDFQDFETKLNSLPGKYISPDGALFLATNKNSVIGCGAIKKLGSAKHKTCEMKRLFVRPEARGLGAGKKLVLRIIEEGIRLGYSTMYLDTLDKLNKAMNLYESVDFTVTEPYYDNPLTGVVYWKMDLKKKRLLEKR